MSRHALAVWLISLLSACGKSSSTVESAPNVPSDAASDDPSGDSTGSGGGNSGQDTGTTGNAQVVYDRAPQRPLPLETDETFLYWGESGQQWRILKAPKSGSGPVEEVGPWSGSEVSKQVIVVDSTHIFWLDDDVIRKVEKSSGAASVIQIGPPPLAGGWVLIADDSYLYFSDRDCTTVRRIPKSGGTPTSFESIDHQPAGGTWLAVDSESLYCGNGPDLLRFPKEGGRAEKLTSVSEGELVGPLISDNIHLYWVNYRAVLGKFQENLARMPKQGGSVTDLGNVGSPAAIIRFDAARNSLYWTTKGSSKYDRVMSYSISDGNLAIMAEGYPVFGGNAQDESYVYWAGRTAIMRLAK